MSIARIVLLIALLTVAPSTVTAAPAVRTQEMPAPIPAENGMVVVQIPVDNMSVEAAAQQARLLLSPAGVVIPDDRTRRLVIKDLPENVEKIRAHLRGSDVALPMVRLAVAFDASHRDSASQAGINGAAVVNNRVYVNGTLSSGASNASDQGSMSVVTMSGSEGVINVGQNIPYAMYPFYFDYALSAGYIAPGVVFQNVSTGFGVVPIVAGDEILLRVYPRVSYLSPTGPGVIRYMDAATEVRVKNGQTVQIASLQRDTRGIFRQILATGGFSSSQRGIFTVTPSIMRDPYAR